jgi:RNA polymerase sigma factor (sigma-70 family)
MAAELSPEAILGAEEWLQSRRLARIVYSVARRMHLPEEDLDDVLQELRIRLWKAGPLTPIKASWIFRTTERKIVDLGRQRHRASALRDVETLGDGADHELLGLLRARISVLPAEFRLVCRLRLSGLSEREIAAELKLSRGRVRRINEWCSRRLLGRLQVERAAQKGLPRRPAPTAATRPVPGEASGDDLLSVRR